MTSDTMSQKVLFSGDLYSAVNVSLFFVFQGNYGGEPVFQPLNFCRLVARKRASPTVLRRGLIMFSVNLTL